MVLSGHTVVRRQVDQVHFGFYTDEEVRQRSVAKISLTQSFDALQTPLRGGLYDPRLGPYSDRDMKTSGSCVTCGNVFKHCPGHCGHMDLTVPVYHTLLFPRLVKLLRGKCMGCHKFRLKRIDCLKMAAKLHLIDQGYVQQAQNLDVDIANIVNFKLGQPRSSDLDGNHDEPPTLEDFLFAKLQITANNNNNNSQTNRNQPKTKPHLSAYENTIRASLVDEFIKTCMAVKACQSCHAVSPKIRQDSYNKIFQQVLPNLHKRSNLAQGIVLKPAMSTLEMEEEEEEEERSRTTKQEERFQKEYGDFLGEDGKSTEKKKKSTTTFEMVYGASDEDSEEGGEKEEEEKKEDAAGGRDKFLHPLEVEAQLRLLWKRDSIICAKLFGSPEEEEDGMEQNSIQYQSRQSQYTQQKNPKPFWEGPNKHKWKIFFLRVLCVPPSRFRPPMKMGTGVAEHPQNNVLIKIIELNLNLKESMETMKYGGSAHDEAEKSAKEKEVYAGEEEGEEEGKEKNDHDDELQRRVLIAMTEKAQGRFFSTWIMLQAEVNSFMDSTKSQDRNASPGIKQVLEKKEGLFRKNMMGKRVNYACRSVISPDPCIGSNEIGIPVVFAKKLTISTPVTTLNVDKMRELVRRGAKQYPGANWVEENKGRGRLKLDLMDEAQREALAMRLLTGEKQTVVGRQLENGDMMLMNRQPTLHKPSIMAHIVRILHNPDQKTVRMHYANCNTYNADFDGDEMNGHCCQDELSLAEARNIMNCDSQYIVPTDGSPLRGLIQDHVDGGVQLCNKDTFLERWQYQQLLFATLSSLGGVEVIASDMDIRMMPPAIRKPRELWTGKQVITTLLFHLRQGGGNTLTSTGSKTILPGVCVEHGTKTPGVAFGESMQEHKVLVRDGELLRGVLDKKAYGASEFSLVHAVFEAYGPSKAGLLLNSLGRLFTTYIQCYSGHSCRLGDLVLTKETEKIRKNLVQKAYNMGSRAARAWADSEAGKMEIPDWEKQPDANLPMKPHEIAATTAKINRLHSGAEGPTNASAYDGYMQSKLNPIASEIIKACLPGGVEVPFPANTFSLMVSSGAKGSSVNQAQVSCGLGQQALEGRRVPRMSSGRTLPSFAPYDPNPRADGFITDRFLSGIRPQEYYFHCMAGREGLVDTAVKTSRSGYLQRCLIKHMEELMVCYDSTVRDGEGAVVQFLYGEDGIDPTSAPYLDCSSNSFQFLARNHAAMKQRIDALPESSIAAAAAVASKSEQSVLKTSWEKGDMVQARRLKKGTVWKRGRLCQGWFDAIVLSRDEDGRHYDLKYVKDNVKVRRVPLDVDFIDMGTNLTPAASSICRTIRPHIPDPVCAGDAKGQRRIGSSGLCVSERVAAETMKAMEKDSKVRAAIRNAGLSNEEYGKLVASKYGSALCQPGEAVGCIAGQSIGEPSTQMTLNTFHLAGSGANVTLGIPRLREIIMTASKQVSTPTMSVPVLPSVSERDAQRLMRSCTKLTLKDVISGRGITVRESLQQSYGGTWEHVYKISLKLHPAERIQEAFGLTLEDVVRASGKVFLAKLSYAMKQQLRRANIDGDVGVAKVIVGMAEEIGNIDDLEEDDAQKKNTPKKKKDKFEEYDDEEGGEEDGVTGSRFGHRKEMASYGDMDDEERQIARKAADEDDDIGMHATDDTAQGSHAVVVTDDERDAVGEEGEEAYVDTNGISISKKRNTLYLPPLKIDPSARPLLMVELVERAANLAIVHCRPKIDEAYLNEEQDGRGMCLQTAGVNFQEIWTLDDLVDCNRLLSNDIYAVLNTYGVEAARMTIVQQIRSVFAVYGISVDPRHLSLIGDFMTKAGGFRAMSRYGMKDASSAFLQMSFETTCNFLVEAAVAEVTDDLHSPSASIVVGRTVRHGTGAFDCLIKV